MGIKVLVTLFRTVAHGCLKVLLLAVLLLVETSERTICCRIRRTDVEGSVLVEVRQLILLIRLRVTT